MFSIIVNGGAENHSNRMEILIETEADLSKLPSCAPGSIAYTAGYVSIWQKNLDNEWVQI